jgi:cyanate lyase
MSKRLKTPPDYILLAEASGIKISDIATELGRSEYWVSSVLCGNKTCDVDEASAIVKKLNINKDYAIYLVVPPIKSVNASREFANKFIDRVVLAGIGLLIAIAIQYQFGDLELERARALDVADVKSSYLQDNLQGVRENYTKLIIECDKALLVMSDPEAVNSTESKEAARKIQGLSTDITFRLEAIGIQRGDLKDLSDKLSQSIGNLAADFIQRDPAGNYFDKKEASYVIFFAFSESVQTELLNLIESEYSITKKRISLFNF